MEQCLLVFGALSLQLHKNNGEFQAKSRQLKYLACQGLLEANAFKRLYDTYFNSVEMMSPGIFDHGKL